MGNIERYVERIADAIWPIDNLSSEEAVEELRRDVRKGLELSGLAADYAGAVDRVRALRQNGPEHCDRETAAEIASWNSAIDAALSAIRGQYSHTPKEWATLLAEVESRETHV